MSKRTERALRTLFREPKGPAPGKLTAVPERNLVRLANGIRILKARPKS